MKILLVEDNRTLASSIIKNLKDEGCIIDYAFDGSAGENMAYVNEYDAIVLDIRLPVQDGWQTCSNLRNNGCQTPIILLTALDDITDKVRGLDCGADDYMTKPFSPMELAARLRALARRPRSTRNIILEYKGIRLDPAKQQVWFRTETIELNSKLFLLMKLFIENPGKVISRQRIFASLWDMNSEPQSNIIEAHIRLLRRKLEMHTKEHSIRTIRGSGYRFDWSDSF